MLYCQPPQDRLPHPEACLLTGITPQQANEQGVIEADFIATIHQQLAQPATCALGYNSIRFDDEVTRYTLYRNFYDPYAREWQNGNSRWDIIDLARACRALRPTGIEWPDDEQGIPNFRLEALTQANQLSHTHAHDALSDVHATIALAKLIKQRQPKLFDYLFQLRNKHKVAELLNIATKQPVLHTSGMISAQRLCTTLMMPLAPHPNNKNSVICYDLTVDPQPLLDLNAEQIREQLYTPNDQLPEDVARIALKEIHINKCPVVATAKLLDDKLSERLAIAIATTAAHQKQLAAAKGLNAKLQQVYTTPPFPALSDPDAMLYSGGFFGEQDKQLMSVVRNSNAEQLANQTWAFKDVRLDEMLFRYRARNYPASLSAQEQARWQDHRRQYLTEPITSTGLLVIDEYRQWIKDKQANPTCSKRDSAILADLLEYGDTLVNGF